MWFLMRHWSNVAAFTVGLHLGCGAPREEAPSPPATPIMMAMARHDRLAIEIRDGLVRADIDVAKQAARALSAVAINPQAAEPAGAMRAAASRVAEAEDLSRAGRAFGELATTCSDCHARAGAPTRVYVGSPPLPATSPSAQMKRHAWAAEQLWIGIVFNSEPPWLAGADVLADHAIAGDELIPGKSAAAEVDARARAVQRFGSRAKETFDTSVRARMYGQLLGVCADCHQRTGGGPSR